MIIYMTSSYAMNSFIGAYLSHKPKVQGPQFDLLSSPSLIPEDATLFHAPITLRLLLKPSVQKNL